MRGKNKTTEVHLNRGIRGMRVEPRNSGGDNQDELAKAAEKIKADIKAGKRMVTIPDGLSFAFIQSYYSSIVTDSGDHARVSVFSSGAPVTSGRRLNPNQTLELDTLFGYHSGVGGVNSVTYKGPGR